MYYSDRIDAMFGFGNYTRIGLAYESALGGSARDFGLGGNQGLYDYGENRLSWLDSIGAGLSLGGLSGLSGLSAAALVAPELEVEVGPVSVAAALKDRVADPVGCEDGCQLDHEHVAAPAPADPNEADTVPGDGTTTATITVGGSAAVTVETLGDHDWYAVNLVAGTTYTIQTGNDGSTTNAFLTLRNAAGASLTTDNDSGDGTNSLITFTATTTGTHYIDAGTNTDATTGSYNLFVAQAFTGGDVGGTIGTASTLALGGTVNGSIEVNGDRDFYAVNLVAGQSYYFRTAPTSTAANAFDSILTLRNSAGTQVAFNDDAGEFLFSSIRFTATTTGTYYLDVGGYDDTTTGAFNLSMFTAPPLTTYTTDQIAFQLTNGYWGGNSFRYNVTAGGSLTYNVQGLTAAGQTLAIAALDLWSDFTGITFNSVATGGQLVFDDNQTGAFASSSRSGSFITSSSINVGTDWINTYGTGFNTYSFQTYIHEIGHALGLGHAGNYNGSADYAVDAGYLNDSWATTIMSYFDQTENTFFGGQGFTRQFVITPIYADALAVANLYGNSTTTRTGDTTYGFNNTSGRVQYDATQFPNTTYSVTDDGGVDTLDYSGFAVNQRINLNPETFSNVGWNPTSGLGRVGNVTIARGTDIENAIGGSGNDTLIGNALNNVLTGNAGSDSIYGGAGSDVIYGAVGDAVLDGGEGGVDNDPLVIEAAGTFTGTIANFEQLVTSYAVAMTATQFASGFSANTQLHGGGTLTINMGAGDSELYLQQLTASSFGMVTVNGSINDDIIKGVLGVVNTINGGDGQDQIRGGGLADVINGGNGDDKLAGAGGADIMTGGGGADTFRYQSPNTTGLGAAADRITDFVVGSDILAFQAIDADVVTPGDQAFSFLGTGAFANTGVGQIRYQNSGANLLVQIDSDGNGVADMEIVLEGLFGQTLTGTSFLL